MALNTTYQIRLEKDSKGILTLVGSDVMRTLFEEMAEKKELIDSITFCNDVEETFLSRQLKYHDEEIRKHEEAKREIMERLEELKERRKLEKECITKERRNMENFWQSLKQHYFFDGDVRRAIEISASINNHCLNTQDTCKYCLLRLKEYSESIPEMDISEKEKRRLKRNVGKLTHLLETVEKDMFLKD